MGNLSSTNPAPLHPLIHEEHYRLQHEQLVFEIANALALAFNIRGNGHKLQYLLDAPDSQTDAETLIRWVNQALLDVQRECQALLLGQLMRELEQATIAKGVLA
ncbi:MAG TPA: hypothetical protein ENG92_02070 [Thiolapillus brandeum]|uniref:Uncharacterized protein n=1 Tax=Thiolapillus brandeum TaxID=1076588 RepID=A0A831K296_9GAMM|nr:hypothetical protein [Thiolapillus brandeum]